MKIASEIADTLFKLMAPEPTTATADPTRIPKMAIHAGSMAEVIAAKLGPVKKALQAGMKCALLVEHEAAEHLIRQSIDLFEEANDARTT